MIEKCTILFRKIICSHSKDYIYNFVIYIIFDT